MLAGGKRLSPTEPTGETGGPLAVDEVEMNKLKNNDCFRNLHLISHFVTASPQGEAFVKGHPDYTVFI